MKIEAIRYFSNYLVNNRINIVLDVFKKQISKMSRTLSKYAYFYLMEVMTIPERNELYADFEGVFENSLPMEDCTYINFSMFFKSQSKLELFKEYYIDNSDNLNEFRTQILAGRYHRPEEVIRKAPRNWMSVFAEGVELYKGAPESVIKIAINYCNNTHMALATEKGSREINIKNSLTLRKRSPDELKLIDEEIDNWDGGLHRFDKVAEDSAGIIKSPFILSYLEKLSTQAKQNEAEFRNFDSPEVIEWNQKNCKEYYMVQSF